jgi:hypothetical protein
MNKVLVDPGVVLFEVQRLNPSVDLTGLKAYLFDLLTAGTELPIERERTLSQKVPEEPVVATVVTGDTVQAGEMMALPPEPPVVVPVRAPAAQRKVVIDSEKSEKEARRDRARKLSEMSSKDILEQLHQQKGPKPNEQGQFIEGTPAHGGADDVFG